MTKEEFIVQCINKYGNQFDYSQLPTKIQRKPEHIRCLTHGMFHMIPRDHYRTTYGCPGCSKDARSTSGMIIRYRGFIKSSIKRYGDKFNVQAVTPEQVASNKIPLTCEQHGTFVTKYHAHIYSEYGCRKCANERGAIERHTFKDVDELLTTAHEVHHNKYTYNRSKLSILLSDYIDITCPKHGVFKMTASSHITHKRGCKACAYENNSNTFDIFVDKANAKHNSMYTYYRDTYTKNEEETKIKHTVCGKVFYQVAKKHLEGQGCLCKIKPSTGERFVMDVLEKYKLTYYREYRIRGYRYRYDFYLPKLSILIEYDGQHHTIPFKYMGGNAALSAMQQNDKNKDDIARSHGIHLIRISYKQINNIEDYLLARLSKYYKYRTRTVWYKNFLDVCRGEKLDWNTTTVKDVKKYLVWTKNKGKK